MLPKTLLRLASSQLTTTLLRRNDSGHRCSRKHKTWLHFRNLESTDGLYSTHTGPSTSIPREKPLKRNARLSMHEDSG